MALVDRLLEHASDGARRAWSSKIPTVVLDLWWARGDHARTYATLDLFSAAPELYARYAALDRDPERAREHALLALEQADSSSIERIALMVPHRDPEVLQAALQRNERIGSRDSLLAAVIDPGRELPALKVIERDHPLLLAWVAVRAAPELALPTLERAWNGSSDHVACALLATRALGAWQIVPTYSRAIAATMLALDGNLTTIASYLAAAEDSMTRGELMSGAALGIARLPDEWIEPIRACAAQAKEFFEVDLITEAERISREFAAAICDGREHVDAMIAAALVVAHAKATSWMNELGTPVPPTDLRAVSRAVANACKDKKKTYRLYGVARLLAAAGAAGERGAVREGIEALERVFGRPALERYKAALAYCPGRLREVAAGLDPWDGAATHVHVALAFAAENAFDEACTHAGIALDAAPGALDLDLVQALARFIIARQPGVRERLVAFVGRTIATLPADSIDDANAWLASSIAAPGSAPVQAARSPELEAALARDEDSAPVYADWLIARGDPRGELVLFHHAGKLAEADALLDEYRDHFLGPLDDFDATFQWRLGFIDTAHVTHNIWTVRDDGPTAAAALATLLDHPSGALLRELVIALDLEGGVSDFRPSIATLEAHAPTTLRRLRIGEFRHAGPRNDKVEEKHEISWTRFGDLQGLWPRLPHLEALTLQGAFPDPTLGSIDIPALRELAIISGGLASGNTRAIASVPRPNLEVLELWFGVPRYGFSGDVDDVLPLLDPRTLPRLHTLRLMNAEFADALIEPLARSRLLPQLREVGLALGTLSDDGAAALARHRDAFSHLAVLDLEDNCLTDDGIELVRSIAAEVRIGNQKDPADERYVSVGE